MNSSFMSQGDLIFRTTELFTPGEIPDEEHHCDLIRSPECVGFFVLFTARRMMWLINPQGQSRGGDYFWEKILTEHIVLFFQSHQNVLGVTQVTFLHDKAPCMKALGTRNLLNDSNSPDLNTRGNVGSILKDEDEKRMLSEPLAT